MYVVPLSTNLPSGTSLPNIPELVVKQFSKQTEDELHVLEQMDRTTSSSLSRRRGLAKLQLASPADGGAAYAAGEKELLETSEPVRIWLFLLTLEADHGRMESMTAGGHGGHVSVDMVCLEVEGRAP